MVILGLTFAQILLKEQVVIKKEWLSYMTDRKLALEISLEKLFFQRLNSYREIDNLPEHRF